MMVHTFLCKSGVAQSRVTAAASILGAMATDFKKQCQKPANIPMVMINGLKDEHLPFSNGRLFEWIDFMSAGKLT
jgi:poly(3-hydroxybutyrate) depolymerase